MKNNLHGWLILDKPLGISSARAVARVKTILRPEKIGHAGTLDPLATGVLPLALGEATKTVPYAMDASKTYVFTVTWGESRDTDDAEGALTATSPVRPTAAQIAPLCGAFTGWIEQVPPAYSAVKVGGKRAYARARAGENVALAARRVWVKQIELQEASENSACFSVTCGKGTYIRSLARDIAHALGTVGYVSALRRTRVGAFDEKNAISLETLEEIVHKGALTSVLRSVESVLDDIPAQEVSSAQAARLKTGQALENVSRETFSEKSSLIKAMHNGTLIAVCECRQGVMKPVRVFNLSGS